MDKELLWSALIALQLAVAALVVDRLWTGPERQASAEQSALQAGAGRPAFDCIALAHSHGISGISAGGRLNVSGAAPLGCLNVL